MESAASAAEMPVSPTRLSSADEEGPDFRRLLEILGAQCGTDLRYYKPGSIRQRAQHRLSVLRLETLGEYVDLLARDTAETEALGEDILIHVTNFFRDAATFELLKPTVFAKLLESRVGTGSIRVWVPGCSSGEEVYSLAIALLEFLSDAGRPDLPIQLFGTDLSLVAIDRARAARYPLSIERDVSEARRQRFFTRSGQTYQIRKDLRDRCVFARHDVTRDPPFSRIDLVSCRNLMIYFGAALKARILPLFHYGLRSPGFLLLGASETTREYPGFQSIGSAHQIYVRTPSAQRVQFDFPERGGSPAPLAPDDSAKGSRQSAFDVIGAADRLVLAQFAPAGVIVSDALTVVQFRGAVGPYLELSSGPANLDLMRMLREDLRLPVRQAIARARSTQKSVRVDGPSTRVETIPLGKPCDARFFLILFERLGCSAGAGEAGSAANSDSRRADQLEHQRASTESYLQSVVEQLEGSNQDLRDANEEVVTSNEELRSTNEELQAAQQELQATNEELRTVNDEMTVRNVESARLTNDLSNVLGSVAIPIVILDQASRVRRFTAPAARLFRLAAGDVGRPIGDIRAKLRIPDLSQMLEEVLAQVTVAERTVRDDDGRWYQLVVRPYLTTDNRVDGTTVVCFDIDALKKTQQELMSARTYAESVIDTVGECLLVVDRDLRIHSGNRAFYRTFNLTPGDAEGHPFPPPGPHDGSASSLAKRLLALTQGASFHGVRETLTLPQQGERTFSLSGRHIDGTPWFLLALDDISEQAQAERTKRKHEIEFQQVLETAADGVLMADAAGLIVFANRMAAKLFGYAREEMVGLPIDALVPDDLRAAHRTRRLEYLAAPSARPMDPGRALDGRRKDGSLFPTEIRLNVVMREGGPLVVSFVRDISARKEAEQSLRDSQERIKQLAFERSVAEERERRRIAIDLHDRIGQVLALAQIKLAGIRDDLSGANRAAVDDAVRLLAQSVLDTRTLTFELSPPVLYDLGLKEALAWLAEQIESEHGLHVEIADDGLGAPLEEATMALVFRAVRELLVNVIKHAQSKTAKVALRRSRDYVEISVEDPGIGFDSEPFPAAARGYGLFSVREQIGRLGGNIVVDSAPRKGTRVHLRLPVYVPTGTASPLPESPE